MGGYPSVLVGSVSVCHFKINEQTYSRPRLRESTYHLGHDAVRLIGTHSMHSDCQRPARIFKGRPDARRTRPEQVALFGRAANCFSKGLASAVGFFFDHTKKRELFPGPGSSSPNSATRAAPTPRTRHEVQSHKSRLGNRYSIPFRVGACRNSAFCGFRRSSSGAAIPRSIAGLAEPCSSSAFEGLACMFATAIEICAAGRSSSTSFRSRFNRHLFCFEREGIGPTLQRHPFSGPIDSAGE